MRSRVLAATAISVLLALAGAFSAAYLLKRTDDSCSALPTRQQGTYSHELTSDEVIQKYGLGPEYIGAWQLRLTGCNYAVFNDGAKVDEGKYNVTAHAPQGGQIEVHGGLCPNRARARYEYRIEANVFVLERGGPDDCPGRTARLVVEPWMRINDHA